MNKPQQITPANGKLGVLLPGMGAVATTFVAALLPFGPFVLDRRLAAEQQPADND